MPKRVLEQTMKEYIEDIKLQPPSKKNKKTCKVEDIFIADLVVMFCKTVI